jgi:two-component system sensor histidine kinase/response regulator
MTTPAIDVAAGLAHMNGDAAMFRRVLLRFSESFGDTAESVLAALAEGEHEQALRLAHTLKGAAGTIGAGMLQGAALRLEQSLRSGTDDCGEQLLDVAAELGRVLREIDGKA